MAHPYSKHAADKVGKARAKGYQSGGKISEAPSLAGREVERRENYAAGVKKLKGPFSSVVDMEAGSPLHKMMVNHAYNNTMDLSRGVRPSKKDE